MQIATYILLGLIFLTAVLYYLFFKKTYAAVLVIISAAVLFPAVGFEHTHQQILLDLLWGIWLLVFSVVPLITYRATKCTVNLIKTRTTAVFFFVLNVTFAVTRFLLCR